MAKHADEKKFEKFSASLNETVRDLLEVLEKHGFRPSSAADKRKIRKHLKKVMIDCIEWKDDW